MGNVRICWFWDRLDALVALRSQRGMSAGGPAMLGSAREDCPVRTGALRDSLTLDISGDAVSVSTDCPYALSVELGGPHTTPQPFLRRAVEPGLDAALDAMAG
jgi:hypothetical protein